MVRPKREPSTPFFKGNHYLRLRNPRHPQMRLVIDNPNKDLFFNEFVWVFEKWEFRVRDDDLFLFLRHNNHLSDSKFHFIKSILCIVINFYVDTDTCLCCCADFNDFFLNRSEECKATIRAVNNM